MLGCGVEFRAHAASKQSVLALVGAGFGVTLVTESQSTIRFPNVIYKPIDEPDAWVYVDLTWIADIEDPVVGRFVAFVRDTIQPRKITQAESSLKERWASQKTLNAAALSPSKIDCRSDIFSADGASRVSNSKGPGRSWKI
jgi:hypothetical protein